MDYIAYRKLGVACCRGLSSAVDQQRVHESLHLPPAVIAQGGRDPLLRALMPCSLGHYAGMGGHRMRRDAGIDEHVVISCVGGAGWLRIAGRRHPIAPGELLVCPAGSTHDYGADRRDPWDIHWFHFRGEDGAELLALMGLDAAGPVARIGVRVKLVTLFQDMRDILEAGYSRAHLVHAAACARQILTQVALRRMYHRPEDPGDLDLEALVAYLRTHLDRRLTLADMAGQAHLSRSHFLRRFRHKTGYPPVNYFIRLKMQRACELLDTSDLPVATIAERLGYQDPYYFSRLFRKVVGRSPRQHRAIPKA